MKELLFLVADYANMTGDGKLNVMGIFEEIYSSNFPARHPSMHLVASLAAELGEYGQERNFTVKLLDEDGLQLLELGGTFQVPIGQRGRKPQINMIFDLKDVVFPKPGIYQIALFIDKDHKCATSLYLNQLEAPKAEK